MAEKGNDSADSWERIYQKEESPGWDVGKTVPPFEKVLHENPAWLTPGALVNPGCGGGHDAHFFASNGFAVTAIDFAPSATALLSKKYGDEKNLKFIRSDFFALPSNLCGTFDYFLEHTFFCAIPRKNRLKYAKAACDLLKPKGFLFGLFYRFDEEDNEGPPFCLSLAELEEIFTPYFDILEVTIPIVSHGKRQGRERFIVMQKK